MVFCQKEFVELVFMMNRNLRLVGLQELVFYLFSLVRSNSWPMVILGCFWRRLETRA